MSILKILIGLCSTRQKIGKKKQFCRYCLQHFSSEEVFMEHKEVCLKVNGKQNVKSRNGSIKFKNYSKQLAVTFKIYANFECVLKGVQKELVMLPKPKNINNIFLVVLLTTLCVLTIDLASKLPFPYEKSTVNKIIKAILKEYDYCKKVMKKHFNKNLVMTVEDERIVVNCLLKKIIN